MYRENVLFFERVSFVQGFFIRLYSPVYMGNLIQIRNQIGSLQWRRNGGGGAYFWWSPPNFFLCTKRFIACFVLAIKF